MYDEGCGYLILASQGSSLDGIQVVSYITTPMKQIPTIGWLLL